MNLNRTSGDHSWAWEWQCIRSYSSWINYWALRPCWRDGGLGRPGARGQGCGFGENDLSFESVIYIEGGWGGPLG
jgi:hypothetical protein